mgnify:CR=1 FL=1
MYLVISEEEPGRTLQVWNGKHSSIDEARKIIKQNPCDCAYIVEVVEKVEASDAEKNERRLKKVLEHLESVTSNDSSFGSKTKYFAQNLIHFYKEHGFLTEKQMMAAENINHNHYFPNSGRRCAGDDHDGAYTADFGWMMNSTCE